MATRKELEELFDKGEDYFWNDYLGNIPNDQVVCYSEDGESCAMGLYIKTHTENLGDDFYVISDSFNFNDEDGIKQSMIFPDWASIISYNTMVLGADEMTKTDLKQMFGKMGF